MVECTDLFGRTRGLTVLRHPRGVVVVSPAGEAAVLSAEQVDQLAGALDAASGKTGGTGDTGTGGTGGACGTGSASGTESSEGSAE